MPSQAVLTQALQKGCRIMDFHDVIKSQFNVNDTVTDMITCTGTPFSSVGVNRH